MITVDVRCYFLVSILCLSKTYSANAFEHITSRTLVKTTKNAVANVSKTPYFSSARFQSSKPPTENDLIFSANLILNNIKVDKKNNNRPWFLSMFANSTYTFNNDVKISGRISSPLCKKSIVENKDNSFWSELKKVGYLGFAGMLYSFAQDTYKYVSVQDEMVRKLIEDIQTDLVENQTRTTNRNELNPNKVVDLRSRQLKIETAIKVNKAIGEMWIILGGLREMMLRLTWHISIWQITNDLEVVKHANAMLLAYKMNDFIGAQTEYTNLKKALKEKLYRPFKRPNPEPTFPSSFISACHNLGGLSFFSVAGAVNEDQDPIKDALLFKFNDPNTIKEIREAFKTALSLDTKNYLAYSNFALLYLHAYNHANRLVATKKSAEEMATETNKLSKVDEEIYIKNLSDAAQKYKYKAREQLNEALKYGLKDSSVLNMCAFYIQCCEDEHHWPEACMYYDACTKKGTPNYYAGRLFMALSQKLWKDQELKDYFMAKALIALEQSYKETPAENGKIWSLYKVLSLSKEKAGQELSFDKISKKAQMKYLTAILNSLNGHDLDLKNTTESKSNKQGVVDGPIFKRGHWFEYRYLERTYDNVNKY